jgi:hypothetical protein
MMLSPARISTNISEECCTAFQVRKVLLGAILAHNIKGQSSSFIELTYLETRQALPNLKCDLECKEGLE